jgi:predicted TIM-barrel fold metal-dependent hydrolase
MGEAIRSLTPYKNTDRLFYDMDAYCVDACVLLPAFGMSNELNAELVQEYPERFVAFCDASEYRNRCADGEEVWSIDGVCQELDRHLSTGHYVGIGEQMPYMPWPPDPMEPVSRVDAIRNMLRIMEVAADHKASVRYHTGCPMGYDTPYSTGSLGPANFNPLWVHDLASAYPEVPIILDHAGVQGWWSTRFYDECLHVAASTDNVYLECGLWWSELYEAALADPNIGPRKLIWGTDWGASNGFHTQYGRTPPTYPVQVRPDGPVRHQIDYWGWSLREVTRLRIRQDDVNLILGGNAIELFGFDFPLTRMFW